MKKFLLTLALCLVTALSYGQGGFNAFQSTSFAAVAVGSTMSQTSLMKYHQIIWTTSGVVSTCQVSIDSSPDGTSWSVGGILAAQTCTSNSVSAITGVAQANFVRINVSTLSGGGSVTIVYEGWAYNPTAGGYVAPSAVNAGGFWPHSSAQAGYLPSASAVTPTINVMTFEQVNLGWSQPVGRFTANVNTGGTTVNLVACIYNSTGTTLLWSANASGNAIATVSGTAAQVTLPPGQYIFAFEENGTASAILAGYSASGPMAAIINQSGGRIGTTANVTTGTVCPASTGVLTPSSIVIPLILLEP